MDEELENEEEGWDANEDDDEMDQLNDSMDFNDENPFTNWYVYKSQNLMFNPNVKCSFFRGIDSLNIKSAVT